MFCLFRLTFLAYEQAESLQWLFRQWECIARRIDADCAAQIVVHAWKSCPTILQSTFYPSEISIFWR